MPPTPSEVHAAARPRGAMSSTAQTRIKRTCCSRLICTARSRSCAPKAKASNVSDRWREGIANMTQLHHPRRAGGTSETRLVDGHQPQQVEIAEHLSGAQHHGSQRIVGDGNRQPGFFADALV